MQNMRSTRVQPLGSKLLTISVNLRFCCKHSKDFIENSLINVRRSFCGVVAKMMDYYIVVRGFKLQSYYHVPFGTNILGKKSINLLYILLWIKKHYYSSSAVVAFVSNNLLTLNKQIKSLRDNIWEGVEINNKIAKSSSSSCVQNHHNCFLSFLLELSVVVVPSRSAVA